MRNLNPTESLYIQLLQDNISRMNQNSMQCKTWCVALIAGILAVVATASKPILLLVGCLIVIGAYFLDCFYLKLEKNFRCFEKRLIDEIKKDNPNQKMIDSYVFDFNRKDLKVFKTSFPKRKPISNAPLVFAEKQNWRDALVSHSTYPVYLVLFVAQMLIFIVLKCAAIA